VTRTLLVLALLAAPAPVLAQADGTVQGAPPQRIRSVLLKPGEICPPSQGDEVVVCSTVDEPYRLPKQFRRVPNRANRAWAARALELDDVGRVAGGLPNSCSVYGLAGPSGCTLQLLRQWRAEREQQKAEAAGTP